MATDPTPVHPDEPSCPSCGTPLDSSGSCVFARIGSCDGPTPFRRALAGDSMSKRSMPGFVHTPACHCVDCDLERARLKEQADRFFDGLSADEAAALAFLLGPWPSCLDGES